MNIVNHNAMASAHSFAKRACVIARAAPACGQQVDNAAAIARVRRDAHGWPLMQSPGGRGLESPCLMRLIRPAKSASSRGRVIKLCKCRPSHFVWAFHQQVNVTPVQRVVQPRPEQPNLRVGPRQFGGGGNNGLDLRWAQAHARMPAQRTRRSCASVR